jgi:hypothetical protein
MMSAMKYVILRSPHGEGLAEKVNAELEKGGELVGGLHINPNPALPSSLIYEQAMMVWKDDDSKTIPSSTGV